MIELTYLGETTREDLLEPINLSAHNISQVIDVQQAHISEISRGQRGISAETLLLLDRFFGLSDGYRLRLQRDHDTYKARRALAEKLMQVHPYPRLKETAA